MTGEPAGTAKAGVASGEAGRVLERRFDSVSSEKPGKRSRTKDVSAASGVEGFYVGRGDESGAHGERGGCPLGGWAAGPRGRIRGWDLAGVVWAARCPAA